MDFNAVTARGNFSAGITAPAPVKPLPGLAERIHSLASDLGEYNERLALVLGRLAGAERVPGGAASEKQPEPQGALMVAQFGAERISQQLHALDEQITRLESII